MLAFKLTAYLLTLAGAVLLGYGLMRQEHRPAPLALSVAAFALAAWAMRAASRRYEARRRRAAEARQG